MPALGRRMARAPARQTPVRPQTAAADAARELAPDIVSRPLLTFGVVAAVVALACLGVSTPRASAHALLAGSRPAAGESLARPPHQLTLSFTEAPDPRLSSVELLDATGAVVAGALPAQSVAGHPAQLRVALTRTLPDGTYTVHWRTVSRIDGHVAESSFVFAVGTAAPPGAAAGGASSTPASLTAAQAVGRWLLYWGLALLVGAAAVSFLVAGAAAPSYGRALLAAAWVLCAGGVAVMTLAERAIVGVSLSTLLGAGAGQPFVARAIAVAVCGLAVAAFAWRPGRATVAAVGLCAAAALLVHVHGGHADGRSPFRLLDLAVQWAHVTAVGVWIGGLAWLLLGLRGTSRAERAGRVRAFSTLAGVALVVVLATGVARAAAELGTLGDLVHTSFGVALLAKLALVAVLVGLGAVNRYRVVPALAAEPGAAHTFGRVARAELVVAAAVLAATAVLSGLAPGSLSAAAAGNNPGSVVVVAGDQARTLTVRLTVTPGRAGANTFAVRVDRYGTVTPAPARSVALDFTLPSHVGLGANLALRRGADGVWRGRGLQLSIVGDWRCEVVVGPPATAVVVPLTVRIAPR
jgi:copper transport protein